MTEQSDDEGEPSDEELLDCANPGLALARKYGHWGDHPDHSVGDWVIEVGEGSTRRGYWDWVAIQLETA